MSDGCHCNTSCMDSIGVCTIESSARGERLPPRTERILKC
nr:MAG TPA: hypothetical protein [Caudoviricetes sp.]